MPKYLISARKGELNRLRVVAEAPSAEHAMSWLRKNSPTGHVLCVESEQVPGMFAAPALTINESLEHHWLEGDN